MRLHWLALVAITALNAADIRNGGFEEEPALKYWKVRQLGRTGPQALVRLDTAERKEGGRSLLTRAHLPGP